MPVEEAQAAVTQYLRKDWKEPAATVSLVQIGGLHQVAGGHLVGPDGTITRGSYGSVLVIRCHCRRTGRRRVFVGAMRVACVNVENTKSEARNSMVPEPRKSSNSRPAHGTQ
ncbi:MAG TPA: hypothetical protein PLF81_06725 [Candidatus Anammoximicrobium sp.]|nr:hypothetical protein [Candidatus Anammoximicrobium sp.]